MENTIRIIPRSLGGLLACLGAVVGFTALSLFFGGSSAHAAERPAGLLDPLASIIDSTTSQVSSTAGGLVTDAVDGIVNPLVESLAPVAPRVTDAVADTVTRTVDPVLEVVASVPVVGPSAAATASQAVNSTVSGLGTVSDTATSLLGERPVDRLANPILSTLTGLPVVGNLVTGLDPLLASGIGGVDSVLGTLGDAVSTAVDPVTGIEVVAPPVPGQPGGSGTPGHDPSDGLPALSGEGSGDLVATPSSTDPTRHVPPRVTHSRGGPVASAQSASGVGDESGGVGAPVPADPLAVPPPSTSSSSSSAGSGGGSGGSAAIASDAVPLSTLDWTRAGAPDDDAPPPAPVFDTDVSPD